MQSKGFLQVAWEKSRAVSDPLAWGSWDDAAAVEKCRGFRATLLYFKMAAAAVVYLPLTGLETTLELAAKKMSRPIDVAGYYERNPKYKITCG